MRKVFRTLSQRPRSRGVGHASSRGLLLSGGAAQTQQMVYFDGSCLRPGGARFGIQRFVL